MVYDQVVSQKNTKIAIIGLGYVGLPLSVAFGRIFETTGFDIDSQRISELRNGRDRTLEINREELLAAKKLSFTNFLDDIRACNTFIITVPTPVTKNRIPDLDALRSASRTVGKVLKKGDYVVYESTVYPGATEEVCIPILEKVSNLDFNLDFSVGYSPERINPGDKEHKLTSITKITSGSNKETARYVDALYKKVVSAGTYPAPSIRVAEAAKVIENTQRDVNIALVNELALIFNRMNIDTLQVLKAAGTKWNFMPFRPGLVGGHCIGVDPYYLTYKAEAIGYHPEVILSGRKLNDGMGFYVANQLVKAMLKKKLLVSEARVLILGLAFKENCPDVRNTRVVDIISELEEFGVSVDVWDPCVDASEAWEEHRIKIKLNPERGFYDGIILAVAHKKFIEKGIKALHRYGSKEHVFYDLKSVFNEEDSDIRL